MDIVNLKMLTALWDTWGRNPPTVPKDGNRLFIRNIDTDPEAPSWDDWKLIGLVNPDGSIVWLNVFSDESLMAQPIQNDILKGLRFSRVLCSGFGMEWGLFHVDGPVEARVSDWAK